MLDYEKKYPNNMLLAGIDEAGRGPLAGPVVCACVIMPLDKNSIIDGVNDSIEDAKNLSKLTKGLMCHINLIPLNFVKERNLQTSKNIYNFEKQLKNMGCSVTVRNSMGSEIDGACGQLRRKHLAEENNE